MQPYFFPYIGYYRLMASVDEILLFDTVQFPRRGWVHRNRIWLKTGWVWVTLPLKKMPRETAISDLSFREPDLPGWREQQRARLQQIALNDGLDPNEIPLPESRESPLSYLERSLVWASGMLGIGCRITRCSDLDLSVSKLDAQEKILTLCRYQGATEYWNLGGGRCLYDHDVFDGNGIKLKFLTQRSDENYESLLGRLVKEDVLTLKAELR